MNRGSRRHVGGAALTELEGAVLGVLHVRAPCTAYAVRREFLVSPSPFWSGSAGAIYPLLERLERRGLVRSRPQATGRRRSRAYEATAPGLAVFRRWLRPPFAEVAVGVPPDPLRTRIEFLGVLTAAQRARFLSEADARVARNLREVERDVSRHRKAGDLYALLAARGSLRSLRARLAWLAEVARALGTGRNRSRSKFMAPPPAGR